jgi:hypothetical protein
MRGDDEFFESVRAVLNREVAQTTVTTTAATGSVLLEGPELALEDLARIALENRCFTMVSGAAGQSFAPSPLSVETALRRASRPATLVPLLIALALVQAARGQIMVPALSLLWFAFEITRNGQGASGGGAGPGRPLH